MNRSCKCEVNVKMATRISLMMEAVGTSETLASSYQSTRRYNPEDGHLCTHRCENLKSYELKDFIARAI
jgi:hypothetical protein